MTKGRIEAFSDGVIAIIITIMVLEIKIPHGATLETLRPLIPIFVSYVLSFIYVGIYWNNHHHTFQAVRHVRGGTLWANLHLLFWLSVVPTVTAWMGENNFAPIPVACYGAVLLMAGVAYAVLTQVLIHNHGRDSILAKAIGKDVKGNLSLGIYTVAIPTALAFPAVSCVLYFAVALIWLYPDKRIERVLVD